MITRNIDTHNWKGATIPIKSAMLEDASMEEKLTSQMPLTVSSVTSTRMSIASSTISESHLTGGFYSSGGMGQVSRLKAALQH